MELAHVVVVASQPSCGAPPRVRRRTEANFARPLSKQGAAHDDEQWPQRHDKPKRTRPRIYFAAKAHETVDTIAERAQRAEREVRGAAAKTAEQARQLQEDATEKAEQSLRRANSYLESNPLAFVGIAFVAGVLLSSLLRR